MTQFRYPPIADYGFISDCHSAALVSRSGSIDWCCMPRFDSPSVFGRLLDWDIGGFCSITPVEEWSTTRSYLEDTLVLETVFTTHSGSARVVDCIAMHGGGRSQPHRQLLRVVEGLRGRIELEVSVHPRFDYGGIRPWIRGGQDGLHSAVGGAAALVVWSDGRLERAGWHDLDARIAVGGGERVRLSIQFARPETIDEGARHAPTAEVVDYRLEETIAWWRRWTKQRRTGRVSDAGAMRSAIVLKGLNNAPTGAMVAAPTTSLPEAPGGERNWDYRFAWMRDSAFTLRSLAELGFVREADGFRRFVERSAAGSVDELQIMYGVGGEHRLTELTLDLEGYRGARPVRVGNDAYTQEQHDVYGVLLDIGLRRHRRGDPIEEHYWRFLRQLVERACSKWKEPDRSIWEVRSEALHYVQSKVMCWVAVDRGIRIAREAGLPADVDAWAKARDEIRAAVENRGYDSERGVFVRSFDGRQLDAALLLLPEFGFVDWCDERMIRTTDAVIADLSGDGLLLRYRAEDGLEGDEGYFLCCSFWLAECLARQGRTDQARAVYERACAGANDLGLFSEEYDATTDEMLGNFPQGLTHLAHIQAALALDEAG